jgi:glycerol uptake facilitator-like aquaporin
VTQVCSEVRTHSLRVFSDFCASISNIDGGGVNPFRSLGVALVFGPLHDVWIFIVGPLLGALIAVGFMWLQVGRLTAKELQNSQGDGEN